jgi:hypothetical protein
MPVADVTSEQSKQPQSGFAELDPDAVLPLAGAGALGLLFLGGAAAVRRRQRRRQEDADEAAKLAFIDANHEHEMRRPASAPAPVASPRHDPIPGKIALAGAPTTRLPNGFDLSRFGPHVRAAYRGPTEDNPSLSLKYRLRRASFLDQQQRRAVEAASAEPRTPIPAKGNWESRTDSDFLFYRAGKKPAPRPMMQD